ncbi:MAG TPA: nuclease [Thermoplasmata archaeon]|nr:nuclease [Thermoplasmata archaeon]
MIRKYIISLIVLLSILFATDWVVVSRVIDGDTFETSSGETVRLIGVDAPETKHPTKTVEYYGKEASEFTKKYLQGKTVQLKYDWQERDKYGRLLAYVFLEDGTFFNALLIKEGYAHAYLKYPFDEACMTYFKKLENDAREAKKGLWAPQKTSKTKNEKKAYWYNSKSGKLHNSSCRWYGNTKEGYYTNEAIGSDCKICGGAHREIITEQKQTECQSSGYKYWINTKSGVRHNQTCRWYGNTKEGYFTNEKVGRPCGICGG